jgi:hypothetical protein
MSFILAFLASCDALNGAPCLSPPPSLYPSPYPFASRGCVCPQRVMLEKHKKAADFRVSFIAYRDFGDSGHLNVTPFTHDIATCVGAVTRESASGGGDTPEDVAGGLKMAASLPWRERSANFLILICDAPCHNSGGKRFHSFDESWGEPEMSARKCGYDRAPPAGCDTSVQRIDPDDQLVYLRDRHKVHFMVTEMSTGSVTSMIQMFEVGPQCFARPFSCHRRGPAAYTCGMRRVCHEHYLPL